MVNVYKSGIAALQFTVEQGKLTSNETKLSLAANADSELEILAKNGSIRVTNYAVHVAPKLITDAAQVATLDTTAVEATKLTTDELTTKTLEANTIVANNSILYHPLLDDGKILDTETVISVHAATFALASAIKELKDATDVEYNTITATTALNSPGILDGRRTGVIQNIAGITTESLASSSASITDLTAVNITGVDGLDAAQVSADIGSFTVVTASNKITTGTLNAFTAISTSNLSATVATLPSITATTLVPTSTDTGISLVGSDSYSYFNIDATGATITDTKSVKFKVSTFDAKTAGVTITGDGVTLYENKIIIPNAVSVIHSLMSGTITSDPDYNALKEDVTGLQDTVDAALSNKVYPTLSTPPTDAADCEAFRLTEEYLPPKGQPITKLSIPVLATNTTGGYLSIYAWENTITDLLCVSDQSITWEANTNATWTFKETPLIIPENVTAIRIAVIANKNAPNTVSRSHLRVKTLPNASPTDNAQMYNGVWYPGRVTYAQFTYDSLLNTALEDIVSLQSDVASLSTSTTESLTMVTNELAALETSTQSDIVALQTDLDRLQEDVDNIEIEGGTGTLTPGEPISTTLIYGAIEAPESVSSLHALVVAASPIYLANNSGASYATLTELKYDAIVVNTDLSYVTINGQSGDLMHKLSTYTPVSTPDTFPSTWPNLVPTLKQISQNIFAGELGALLTRPLIVGSKGTEGYSQFTNVLPYCTLALTDISGYVTINKNSFSFATEAINNMRSSRVFDLELRLTFSSESSDCPVLIQDILYASSHAVNGTPVSGLLYAGFVKTYSGTLRTYPDQTWVLFDNYATFY